MDIKDKILEAKANKSYIHLPAAHDYRMDWNEFIDLFGKMKRSINPDSSKNKTDQFIGSDQDELKMLKYNNFDYVLFNTKNLNEKTLEIFSIYTDFINKKDYSKTYSCIKTLANFIGDEGPYGIHPDPHDVMALQLLGQVEYRIYQDVPESRFHFKDNSGLEYKSYILNPGDIFFMTSGIIHQSFVSEPRITTIIDISLIAWDI